MRNVIRLLTAAAMTVFIVPAASADSDFGNGLRNLGRGVTNLGKGVEKGIKKVLPGSRGRGGRASGNAPGKEHAGGSYEHHVGGKGTSTHDLARPGGLAEHHGMKHMALTDTRAALVDHAFKMPGDHLHRRLRKLSNYHWHSHYKRVAIAVTVGGDVACDVYCEFNVPDDVYQAFIAAADGARAPDVELKEHRADNARFGDLPEEEALAKRVEEAQGWNKAVIILEKAVAQEKKEIEAAQKDGKEAPAVFDEPDEQIDVLFGDEDAVETVADGDGANETGKKQ